MGFAGRIHELRWPPGHRFYAMQVDIRAASVATLNEMSEGRREGESVDQATRRRLALLCKHIARWNLENPDTGAPLPIERDPVTGTPSQEMVDALMDFDSSAVGEVMEAWADDGRIPDPSKDEDAATGRNREPIDPLGESSAPGLPTGASSAVEASIPTQDVP